MLNENLKMQNGNNLVVPQTNKVDLGNGVAFNEQRGKKDLMWGQVLAGDFKGSVVLYPQYAADTFNASNLHTKHTHFHIIDNSDIVLSLGVDNTPKV